MHRLLWLLLILSVPALASAASAPTPPGQWVARAQALQNHDDPAALKLVEQALADDRLQGGERAQALGLRCWLTASTAIGKVEAMATRDLPVVEGIGDAKALSDLHACRGYAREDRHDLAAAARDYEDAFVAGKRAGDPGAIAQAAVFRGEVRYVLGDTANALADLQLAWRLQKQRGDAKRANYALNAIANLYADTRVGEFDKALLIYRQLLAVHEAARDQGEIATAWFNIAATLDLKGDHAGAVDAFGKALDLQVRQGDPGQIAETRRALGVSLVKLGKGAQALGLFDQAIAGFQSAKDVDGVADARLSRAIGLRHLGRLADANADFAFARDYFTRQGNLRYLDKLEGEQALAYADAKDWQHAYAALAAQVGYREELAARLKRETTTRMRVAFDTARTEAENQALAKQNALKQQALDAARRNEALQQVVIALVTVLVLLLAWTIVRTLRNARRLRELALTDELTHLPNRRHVFDIAHRTADAAHEVAAPWSVLALDIDHFKAINDRFGHDAGDKVLTRVAAACAGAVRKHDVVGRIGGEEFLVVLPRSGLKEACEVGERIRVAVQALVHDDIQHGLKTTISIGAAQSRPGDKGVGTLAKRADACLYAAKEGGRNRVASAPAQEPVATD